MVVSREFTVIWVQRIALAERCVYIYRRIFFFWTSLRFNFTLSFFFNVASTLL